MKILNVEIKARHSSPETIRSLLKQNSADFKGTDHQTDTYFNVDKGRLKLREGNIENSLIFYRRPNTGRPKASDINLIALDNPQEMKTLLTNALGIKVIVEKDREIYFINNVKFHIDEVEKLGCFVEVEAIDRDDSYSEAELREQCQQFMDLFGISDEDLVSVSYSDMLLEKK